MKCICMLHGYNIFKGWSCVKVSQVDICVAVFMNKFYRGHINFKVTFSRGYFKTHNDF